MHTICIWNIKLLFLKPKLLCALFIFCFITKTRDVFMQWGFSLVDRKGWADAFFFFFFFQVRNTNVSHQLGLIIPCYVLIHKQMVFVVNSDASQLPRQCERSMNSCGYRVGCRLVSVPRTAAHSNTPLSSPCCLHVFFFFFFFFSFIQDGE